MPVISICLSPGFQRSVFIDTLIPGEVNRLAQVYVDAAGKGVNVCRVLQRLDIEAVCLAQGGDNADELMSLAAAEGMDLRLLPSSGRLRTCTSIVETSAASRHRVTELVEPSSPVDASCVHAMTAAVQALLPSAAALVIAGSAAPGYPPGYQARLAAMALASRVPVLLDLQGAALRAAVAVPPAVVKINLAEFAATFLPRRFGGGEHGGMLAQPVLPLEVKHAVAEASRSHATSYVLTRGANSVLLARQGELREVALPALVAEETVNTVGCGDAFLAGMLVQLLRAGGSHALDTLPLDVLERSIGFATACAQSNARTARPGLLEEAFASSP
jgi:fructose-1-phosphate kinase PfkB-like protein